MVMKTLLGVALLSLVGCGETAGDVANPDLIQFAFEVPQNAQTAATVTRLPFPSDLLLGSDGRILVSESSLQLPDAKTDALQNLLTGLSQLKCFGTTNGVVFPLATRSQLTEEDAVSTQSAQPLATLVNLRTGEKVPTNVVVRPIDDQVFVRPVRGVVLQPGDSYAAFLREGVTTIAGQSLAAAPLVQAALGDADSSAEVVRVRSNLAPLATWLDGQDIPRQEILTATVFTVCDRQNEMVSAMAQIEAQNLRAVVDEASVGAAALDELLGKPANNDRPGRDNPGGRAHKFLKAVVRGHFASHNFASEQPSQHGHFVIAEDSEVTVRGQHDVPFLLALPKDVSLENVPVIVLQHGLGDSRYAVLSVANRLAERGFATIGIDLPFHGDRLPRAQDEMNNATGALTPDGFADGGGEQSAAFTFTISTEGDEVQGVDIVALADTFRQGALDLGALTQLIKNGDWSELNEQAGLENAVLSSEHLVLATESLGGIVGATTLSFSSHLRAGFLAVPGGNLLGELVENSPDFSPLLIPFVGATFGVPANQLDPGLWPPHSHLMFQLLTTLVDVGDPITYASRTAERDVHIAIAAAYRDETVPNHANEALGRALGLDWASMQDMQPAPHFIEADAMAPVAAPVAGNQQGPGGALTRVMFEMSQASHGMLTAQNGGRSYQPDFPPFLPLAKEERFVNPIDFLQQLLAGYAESYAQTGIPRIATP